MSLLFFSPLSLCLSPLPLYKLIQSPRTHRRSAVTINFRFAFLRSKKVVICDLIPRVNGSLRKHNYFLSTIHHKHAGVTVWLCFGRGVDEGQICACVMNVQVPSGVNICNVGWLGTNRLLDSLFTQSKYTIRTSQEWLMNLELFPLFVESTIISSSIRNCVHIVHERRA